MISKEVVRLLLRIPTDLYQRVKDRAEQLNISINSVIVRAIEHGLLLEETGRAESLVVNQAKTQFSPDFIGFFDVRFARAAISDVIRPNCYFGLELSANYSYEKATCSWLQRAVSPGAAVRFTIRLDRTAINRYVR
jgi:hypothetical protein